MSWNEQDFHNHLSTGRNAYCFRLGNWSRGEPLECEPLVASHSKQEPLLGQVLFQSTDFNLEFVPGGGVTFLLHRTRASTWVPLSEGAVSGASYSLRNWSTKGNLGYDVLRRKSDGIGISSVAARDGVAIPHRNEN